MVFVWDKLRFHLGSVAALVVFLVVVALSVCRCTAIHGFEFETPSPKELAEKELDAELVESRRFYTQATRAALKVLKYRDWVSDRTGSVVRVTDTCLEMQDEDTGTK